MGIFEKPKIEEWIQLSEELNANYIESSFFLGPRIEYIYNNWIIYLDVYTVSSGKTTSTTYTRMRLPFINPRKFHFEVYRKGPFSNIGKSLGMQDIEIGYDSFDNEFVIKGNDEVLLRRLLINNDIRNLIEIQPRIHFEIKDNEGMLGPKFNDNESELFFHVGDLIIDKDKLKNLFELFIKVIDEFEMIGITVNQTPEVKLYKE